MRRTKILFVCHGNICRSPMAEFIMKDKVAKAGVSELFEIASAATSTEEIGNPVYPPARRELLAHGIDPRGKFARQMTYRDYQQYDYVVIMDEFNQRNIRYNIRGGDTLHKVYKLLDFTENPHDIEDPWYYGDFDRAYAEIDEGCSAFLEYLLMRK